MTPNERVRAHTCPPSKSDDFISLRRILACIICTSIHRSYIGLMEMGSGILSENWIILLKCARRRVHLFEGTFSFRFDWEGSIEGEGNIAVR